MRFSDRAERLLLVFGTWWPNYDTGDLSATEHELRVENLLFYMLSSQGDRKYLVVQTLPLETHESRVLFNKLFPELADRQAIETKIIPLINRMLLLDDLAEC